MSVLYNSIFILVGQCKLRHESICPELKCIGSSGNSKGKYCPHPHKVSSTLKKGVANESNTEKPRQNVTDNIASTFDNQTLQAATVEAGSRKRYYDESITDSEEIEKSREMLLRKVEIMKRVTKSSNQEGTSRESNLKIPTFADTTNDTTDKQKFKRPPIGPLPAFIPIS